MQPSQHTLFPCSCLHCQSDPRPVSRSPPGSPPASEQPSSLYDQDLAFILRRLAPVPGQDQAYQFVSIRVLETVIYSQGVPRVLVYNDSQGHLKHITHRERLTSNEIRKFMAEHSQMRMAKTRNSPRLLSRSSLLSMGSQGTRPEQYREFSVAKYVLSCRKNPLVSYSQQTYPQFSQLLSLRHSCALWLQLSYLQAAPSPSTDVVLLYDSSHTSKAAYKQAFESLLQVMEIDHSAASYSRQRIEEVLKHIAQLDLPSSYPSAQEFLEYQVYKVIAYLDVFHGLQVTSLKATFTLFHQVHHLSEVTDILYLSSNNQFIHNYKEAKRNLSLRKARLQGSLEKYYRSINVKERNRVDIIQRELTSAYENMKETQGIVIQRQQAHQVLLEASDIIQKNKAVSKTRSLQTRVQTAPQEEPPSLLDYLCKKKFIPKERQQEMEKDKAQHLQRHRVFLTSHQKRSRQAQAVPDHVKKQRMNRWVTFRSLDKRAL